ncbi:PGAP1-domain-containing protein [Violaceomyces palustris]|uniref:PGAP1-domain-containing protein n=1 Tax=Violaceomyces palustris TaxID=1673888 RepID=A0ACD0NPK6_9BASI|nr:PGAP1-domain-containing protein [Violaceomyces palustris]
MTSPSHPSSSARQKPAWISRPWLLTFLILLTSSFLAILSLSSFASLPRQLEIDQQCRMSRMFPSYNDHTAEMASYSPSGLHKKYKLYLYREGNYDKSQSPNGSPALYVPGNSGSYAQIRSVASSSARQYWRPNGFGVQEDFKDAKGPVDWWTVDFNEDFSAFHGNTLEQQATFLNEVVAYLRSIYLSPPTHNLMAGDRKISIPILAHSMGGIAARLMSHVGNYQQDSVDTIVTLSSPHGLPPVPFDKGVQKVYDKINHQNSKQSGLPPLIISIAGGLLDTQLPSDPTSLSLAGISADCPAARISTYTSSMPALWSSVDHLAIMWCDQLREKIARAFLLDSVAFGMITEERNQGGTSGKKSGIRRRRELWRRALGLNGDVDAGGGERGLPGSLLAKSLAPSGEDREEPEVTPNETPILKMDTTGSNSILRTASASEMIFYQKADEPPSSFELITNLCVGANPSDGSGLSIPQPIEIVVLLCSKTMDPSDPNKGTKAACELVLPWRWELMPPSVLPDPRSNVSFPDRFPDAHRVYAVPGDTVRRLSIDSRTLAEKRIDFIRVERKAEDGMFLKHRNLASFIRADWVKEVGGPTVRRAASIELVTHPSEVAGDGDLYQVDLLSRWSVARMDTSLLAYEIELVPNRCYLDALQLYLSPKSSIPITSNPRRPAYAPILQVANYATGDSRWYPELVPKGFADGVRRGKVVSNKPELNKIRLPLALHGTSPFLPPSSMSSEQGVSFKLWHDPVLTAFAHNECPKPFKTISVRRRVRASAGLLVLRYRLFLASWPMAVLCVVSSLSWRSWARSVAARRSQGCSDQSSFPSLLETLTSHSTVKVVLPCLVAGSIFFQACQSQLYHFFQPRSAPSWLVDSLLGIPTQPGLGFLLGPSLLLISYTSLVLLSVVLDSTLLLLVKLIRATIGTRTLVKLSWGHQTWNQAKQPMLLKRSSLVGIGLLLISVLVFMPSQFAFLVVFLIHCVNTLRSRADVEVAKGGRYDLVSTGGGDRTFGSAAIKAKRSDEVLDEETTTTTTFPVPGEGINATTSVSAAGGGTSNHLGLATIDSIAWSTSRYNQHHFFLLLLLLLLPLRASVLLVWARNLSVGWTGLSNDMTDHNPLDVGAFILLTWIFAGGRKLEPGRRAIEGEVLLPASILLSGIDSILWGLRHTYRVYDGLNLVVSLALICHWRGRRYGSEMIQAEPIRSTARRGPLWENTPPPRRSWAYERLEDDGSSIQMGGLGSNPQSGGHTTSANLDLPPSSCSSNLAGSGIGGQRSGGAGGGETEPSLGQESTQSIQEERQEKDPDSEGEEIQDDLQELLEEYLETIETYQEVVGDVSKRFSEAFLRLSKAKMEMGGGTRLGKDSYDQRILNDLVVDPKLCVSRIKRVYSVEGEEEEGDPRVNSIDRVGRDDETEGLRRRRRRRRPVEEEVEEKDEQGQKDEPKRQARKNVRARLPPDPLHQFSALPTPSLRQAQSDFTSAVDRLLGVNLVVDQDHQSRRPPGVLELVRKLQALEASIVRQRRRRRGVAEQKL